MYAGYGQPLSSQFLLASTDNQLKCETVSASQVHDLLKLYNEIGVSPERLLFKIPSTWQVSIAD